MNNKLTLYDCYKYPNAKIVSTLKEYNKPVYANITTFMGALVKEMLYRNYIIQDIEDAANKQLKNFKLILRPNILTAKEVRTYQRMLKKEKYYVSYSNYCRSINVDYDNMKEKGLAVYE